jgi:hypothetical protein
VRSDIEEDLIPHQHARPAVVQAHLDRFRRHEMPGSHDQVDAARFIVLQVHGDQAFDHVALPLPDFGHIDRGGPRRRPKPRGVMH